MATALTPIAWTSLASASSSVTFSSIPGTYRDLYLVTDISSGNASDGSQVLRFNSDSGSNYSTVSAEAQGSAVSSSTLTTNGILDTFNVTTVTNNPAVIVWHILDYSATDKHKSVLARESVATSRTAVGVGMIAGRWANTSAISSITLVAQNSTTYAAGSTFALYGIAA
jgi:hypothetical protein